MIKQYGIYQVEETYDKAGRFAGYKCSVVESTGKQGKLYLKTDGRENYQAAPKPEPKKNDTDTDDELDLLP